MSGIERIAAERQRQIEVEGWSVEHDAVHDAQELTRAAKCYIAAALHVQVTRKWITEKSPEFLQHHVEGGEESERAQAMLAAELEDLVGGVYGRDGHGNLIPPQGWPIAWNWNPSDDPIRNLERAGALIAAEIDRLEGHDGDTPG